MCVVSRKNGAPDSTARSIVPWTEDQAAFAPSKSAGPIGHAAIDPQTGGSAHIGRVIRFFFNHRSNGCFCLPIAVRKPHRLKDCLDIG